MKKYIWIYIIGGLIVLGIGIAGFVLRDQLQSAAQISKLTAELKRDPNNYDAAYGLGVAYFKTHDYTKAVEFYTKASQIKKDSAEALNNLGNTYRKMLRFQDAETSYLAAIATTPTYTTTYINLVNLYEVWAKDNKDKEKEIPTLLLKGIAATKNNPTLLRELIDYYKRIGDQTNATKYQKILDSL